MDTYKIMIVDDEADVREGIVRHIDWKAIGFEVIAEAENGQDALEKAEATQVDVVLTDIQMPFLDGLAMCERLNQLYPAIKVILLTGFDEFEYAKTAIKVGAVEYILKPVNVAELTEILWRVKRLLDENIAQKRNIDALRQNYEKSLPLMREHFLNELLWGTVPEVGIDEQLARYDLRINETSYQVVAVFEVEQGSKRSPVVAWELVPLSVKQMVEEYLEGRCEYAVFISPSAIIAITAWDNENPIGEMMHIVGEICARCLRVLELCITAGVGRCYQGMGGIHNSFLEAKSALEYKIITGTGKAISIQDMERVDQERVAFDDRSEQQLLSAIKFGTYEQIRMLIADILGKMEGCSTWERQAYMLSIFNAVYRIIQRYSLHTEQAVAEQMQQLTQMLGGWDVKPEAGKQLCDICVCMSECISAKRTTAAKMLVEEAKRFIDEHYQDIDLSVERLCQHLHVSQSYFSTVFKQETGTSYVQYLTEVRMGQAITLLQETDDKTYMIAHKVGYEEPNYFSYVFKKRFGVSPTRYREKPVK